MSDEPRVGGTTRGPGMPAPPEYVWTYRYKWVYEQPVVTRKDLWGILKVIGVWRGRKVCPRMWKYLWKKILFGGIHR